MDKEIRFWINDFDCEHIDKLISFLINLKEENGGDNCNLMFSVKETNRGWEPGPDEFYFKEDIYTLAEKREYDEIASIMEANSVKNIGKNKG